MPLGLLDETQIDLWVKAQNLDELTFTSANDLLEYLSVLPITRPASQAHLPMTATRILVNKRKDECALCNGEVLAGLGLYVFNKGGWRTYHESETCPAVTQLPELKWDSVTMLTNLELFVYELERMPKVVVSRPELVELSKSKDAQINFDLELPLLPYQRAGVKYALEARRVLLADSMGLGKTAQGIALALDTKMNGGKTLVVVPPHLRLQWLKEFRRFAPSVKVITVKGRKTHGISRHDVLIIGDSVVGAWAMKLAGKYKTLIVDEAHSMKNEKTQRAHGVKQIANSIPANGIIALMSGTLTPNRPSELLSPLRIIGRLDNVFGSRKQFLMKYCDYRMVNGFPNMNGASNTTELNTVLRGTCMVRRRKEDVLSDLPDKRRAQLDVELTDGEMNEYRTAERDFLRWVMDKYGADAWQRASKAEVITRMNKLRELLGIAKVNAVVEHVNSLIAEGEQVVVFAYHRQVLKALYEKLEQHGIVMVAGGSTPEAKQRYVERFTDKQVSVFLGQYESAGTGLNLTSASHVVLAEMPYSPSTGQQAEDRCHRIGQSNHVVAWWITAVDAEFPTIDMRLWSLLNAKAESTSAVLDGWAENLNADAGTMTAKLLQDMMNDYK
jgi:SNF2 family DNA or RNA helicase